MYVFVVLERLKGSGIRTHSLSKRTTRSSSDGDGINTEDVDWSVLTTLAIVANVGENEIKTDGRRWYDCSFKSRPDPERSHGYFIRHIRCWLRLLVSDSSHFLLSLFYFQDKIKLTFLQTVLQCNWLFYEWVRRRKQCAEQRLLLSRPVITKALF